MTAGITPMRTSLKLNEAASEVITMSEAATRPRPPANAAPLIAAMTGLSPSHIWLSTSEIGTTLPPAPACPGGFLRSAPAQNALPFPVSTMQRTASSAFAATRWSYSSVTRPDERALRASGRFNVIQAAPSRTS
jgi:hypothetical protein